MNTKFTRLTVLLEFADDQQAKIADDFSQNLNGDIPETLWIKTKNYFENARSVLDYIAHEICVNVLKLEANHKCYFPLNLQSPQQFEKFCRKNFPAIEECAPIIYNLLRAVQPFENIEFTCFKQLVEYSNSNKHRDLSEQVFVKENYSVSKFKVVRFSDIEQGNFRVEGVNGYITVDETREDPFLGSDFMLANIGQVIEVSPEAMLFKSPKFADSGDDVITTLVNIQRALRKVVNMFAEPVYGYPAID
jgi:hypothetical protein